MTDKSAVGKAVETTAKGVMREQSSRIRDRVEPPADQFKEQVADRLEGVADQVRQLGRELDRRDEAHVVARRLERSADYVRYRPASEFAGDAWGAMKSSPMVWVAGGVLGAFVTYRVVSAIGNRRS